MSEATISIWSAWAVAMASAVTYPSPGVVLAGGGMVGRYLGVDVGQGGDVGFGRGRGVDRHDQVGQVFVAGFGQVGLVAGPLGG